LPSQPNLEKLLQYHAYIRAKLAARSFERYASQTCGFDLHHWQKILCRELQRLNHESGVRLLVHGPPQYGKSILVSKRFPAWWLGHNPRGRVVLAAYNQTHALNLAEAAKSSMSSEFHKHAFDGQTFSRWNQTQGGWTAERADLFDGQPSLNAVGMLSGLTGTGFDLLVVDDPYSSPEKARSSRTNAKIWRWWTELVKVRMNPKSNVVVMFHRYHEDDFAGRLLKEGGWKLLRFPAIADENLDGSDITGRKPGELLSPIRTREMLEQIKDKDPFTFASQFQGVPIPESGGFIRDSDLKVEIKPPRLQLWVRYFDLAVSSSQSGDYTAGVLLGQGLDASLHLVDVLRFKLEWPDAKSLIIETLLADYERSQAEGFEYWFGMDARLTQQALYHDLIRDPRVTAIPEIAKLILPDKSPGDKKERAAPWVTRARAGQFYVYPQGWNLDALIQEARAFTGDGKDTHDDQIDAISGAFSLIYNQPGGIHSAPPPWRSAFALRNPATNKHR
jgi:predicted phage terminase large subunit-like protein